MSKNHVPFGERGWAKEGKQRHEEYDKGRQSPLWKWLFGYKPDENRAFCAGYFIRLSRARSYLVVSLGAGFIRLFKGEEEAAPTAYVYKEGQDGMVVIK